MFIPRPVLTTLIKPQVKVTPTYKRLNIDTVKLLALVKTLQDNDVTYAIDSADPPVKGKCKLSADATKIDSLDCSAFVRYALYQSTNPPFSLCDGSVRQEAAIKAAGFEPTDYRRTGGAMDDRVRIAFMTGHPGHVWLVLDGQTIESHGGVGPDRRSWSTKILLHNVSKCYLLT